ncbi:MAG: hypothetical protein Q8M71_01800 [Thermodesulfovibrionales bacterium]|nr:hypothetical protein [Thermodesulfovibrionales bacterium]
MKVTKLQLINKPENRGRHVVILGAGASKQAFPEGDANGKILPAMDDLITVLRLEAIMEQAGIEYQGRNFEAIYSELYEKKSDSVFLKEIHEAIYSYFSSLQLPEHPTLYDHLLLSLCSKDLVATFNWDPFLYDAWERNVYRAPLPKIAYLYGNVRIGYCLEHRIKGEIGMFCPECDKELTPSRLLYPITMKSYTDDPFIEKEWDLLKIYLSKAFTLTIIGYSAPTTDQEAIDIMKSTWDKNNRFIERTEVIDIKDEEVLWKQWSPFIVRTYFDCIKDFYQSRIPNFPRRTCDALLYSTRDGFFVEKNPLPRDADFDELSSWLKSLVEAE